MGLCKFLKYQLEKRKKLSLKCGVIIMSLSDSIHMVWQGCHVNIHGLIVSCLRPCEEATVMTMEDGGKRGGLPRAL